MSTTTRSTRKGEKFIDDPSFHNADFAWETIRQMGEQIVAAKHTAQFVSQEKQVELHDKAQEYWNWIYSHHQTKMFPMKNYIWKCFVELSQEQSSLSIMEAGCGSGATLFPLVRKHGSNWTYYAFDFSQETVALIQNHDLYKENASNIHVFVWNLASCACPYTSVPPQVDYFLLVFVLSAIHPNKMKQALQHAYDCLKPGGVLLFRDYGLYDITQLRLPAGSRMADVEHAYVRGDNTTCYFFSKENAQSLFESCGYVCLENDYHCNKVSNKKKDTDMFRIFIHGKYQKPAL